MRFHMFFSEPIQATIPDQLLSEMMRDMERRGCLQLPKSPFTPEVYNADYWGVGVTNHGQRTLRLAEFDRDMFWEKEVDDVYDRLVTDGTELALIEDLLAAMDDPVYAQLPRGLKILCLGSPVVIDLEPLFMSFNTRSQSRIMGFTPYEGCYSSSGSRVLVADLSGDPSPRSPHFPFPTP